VKSGFVIETREVLAAWHGSFMNPVTYKDKKYLTAR